MNNNDKKTILKKNAKYKNENWRKLDSWRKDNKKTFRG